MDVSASMYAFGRHVKSFGVVLVWVLGVCEITTSIWMAVR